MNRFFLTITILLIVFTGKMITACTEPIDLRNDGMDPMLVITCVLTDSISAYPWNGFVSENEVVIAKTTPFFGEMFREMVSGAKVWINSDTLTMTSPGVYSFKENFLAIPGKTYTLEVHYDMNNDGVKEIYTAKTTMPQKHHLDSISIVKYPISLGRGFEGTMFLHFKSPYGKNWYGAKFNNENDEFSRFYSSRILRYCVFQYDLFANDKEYQRLNADWFIRHSMPYDNENIYPLYAGDTLSVELNVLSQEYHRYLEVAKIELSQNNPMFSGPRSNVPTNIQGGAIGIFGAYTSSCATMHLPLDTPGLPMRPR